MDAFVGLRDASPIGVYDETLEASRDTADREELARQSALRRPYEIGSISALNDRISSCERHVVNTHLPLVIERPNKPQMKAKSASYTRRATAIKKDKESPETVYEPTYEQRAGADKAPTGEPVLVEMAEFPGFSENSSTPLPESLNSNNILKTVVRAQTDLQRKLAFKAQWESLFLSEQSEAIFLDCFWCYFLQKFQPNQSVQDRLFHRTAFTYIGLLQLYIDPRYRESFFKRYPDCICQAVYHTFFIAYPTSYQQFGEDFKQGLCNFVYLWLTGIQPVPRCWLCWNFSVLEPSNMFKMVADQEKRKENELVKARNVDVCQMLRLPHDEGTSHSIQSHIQSHIQSNGSPANHSLTETKVASSSKVTSPARNDPVVCRPRETTSAVQKRPLGLSQRESCPVGEGPEFNRSLFNINGHSPLVAYYLSVMNASPDTVVQQLIQRTEISKLPPLDAKTYSSVIRESAKSTKETDSKCHRLWEDERQETARLHCLRASEWQSDIRKSKKLLTQTKEVKRLSNLLTIELLQNAPEDNTATDSAAEEIAKVLAKQEAN